LDKLATQYD